MKVFEIQQITRIANNQTRIPLVFGNLEECIFPGNIVDLMIKNIVENENLAKITIKDTLYDRVIEELTGKLPNLEEVIIHKFGMNFIDSSNSITILKQFLNQAHKLKKVSILETTSDMSYIINEQLSSEWYIKIEQNINGDSEKVIMTRN